MEVYGDRIAVNRGCIQPVQEGSPRETVQVEKYHAACVRNDGMAAFWPLRDHATWIETGGDELQLIPG